MNKNNKGLISKKDYLEQINELKPDLLDCLPVAYVVFDAIYADKTKEMQDLRFIYANPEYTRLSKTPIKKLIGELFSKVFPKSYMEWVKHAYRVIQQKKTVKDIVYSEELKHWISFVASQGPKKNSISFVFVIVDNEVQEKDRLMKDTNTDHFLVELNKLLDSPLSYDQSIHNVLEEISTIIHPDRIHIVEKSNDSYSSTYEWHKKGLESELPNLQARPTSHFGSWNDAVQTQLVIDIPDVQEFNFDPGQKEYFARLAVKRLIMLPLFNNGKPFGFITIYNPRPDDDYDLKKVLTTFAYIISTSLIQHHVFEEFEHFSKYDALTNIYSRYGFTVASEKYMKENPGQVYNVYPLSRTH